MTAAQVAGHGLLQEGRAMFAADGHQIWHQSYPAPRSEGLRAKCRCGALSPPGITVQAARNWHRGHKAEVLLGWAK